MAKPKKKKIRADFRKNRAERTRPRDLTRHYAQQSESLDDQQTSERISGKGALTRKRTIVVDAVDADNAGGSLAVDAAACMTGRVLRVHGLNSVVQTDDGPELACATRRLLKTLNTEQRQLIVAGDRVSVRRSGDREGIIERVEPRYGCLSRTSRGRRHVLVANVDQVLVIASAAQPELKPHLIDRMLVSAEAAGIEPILCINKIDLVQLADLQPLVGVYAQLGYRVACVSAHTGFGIQRLGDMIQGKQSAVVGQSGVGKSSLLNAIQPDLDLRVRAVSAETEKGRHTTTTALLVPIDCGGYIVDTPGIRQFQLWDVVPAEVANYFRDIRPYISLCHFPDCTHQHESDCAVKDAVADNRLDARRYESYCHLLEADS